MDPTNPQAPRAKPARSPVLEQINSASTTLAPSIAPQPPHKLPLGLVFAGLEDMELDEVLRHETNTPQGGFRRLIAAVITRAFSYMVKIGVEYGCVCTSEAFVFLRMSDDPRTAYSYPSPNTTSGRLPDGCRIRMVRNACT
jgi:hypothetical protein